MLTTLAVAWLFWSNFLNWSNLSKNICISKNGKTGDLQTCTSHNVMLLAWQTIMCSQQCEFMQPEFTRLMHYELAIVRIKYSKYGIYENGPQTTYFVVVLVL